MRTVRYRSKNVIYKFVVAVFFCSLKCQTHFDEGWNIIIDWHFPKSNQYSSNNNNNSHYNLTMYVVFFYLERTFLSFIRNSDWWEEAAEAKRRCNAIFLIGKEFQICFFFVNFGFKYENGDEKRNNQKINRFQTFSRAQMVELIRNRNQQKPSCCNNLCCAKYSLA